MSKYDPLTSYLTCIQENVDELTIRFSEIEKILGCPLPDAAYKGKQFWVNDSSFSKMQSVAWLTAGWRINKCDLIKQEVVFIRT